MQNRITGSRNSNDINDLWKDLLHILVYLIEGQNLQGPVLWSFKVHVKYGIVIFDLQDRATDFRKPKKLSNTATYYLTDGKSMPKNIPLIPLHMYKRPRATNISEEIMLGLGYKLLKSHVPIYDKIQAHLQPPFGVRAKLTASENSPSAWKQEPRR
jgi:hypothetical protein